MPNENMTLLGVWVPRELADLFALRALYERRTKSAVLKGLAQRYVEDSPEMKNMIHALAGEYVRVFYTDPLQEKQTRKISWEDYIINLRRSLVRKLPPHFVDKIIDEMYIQRREQAI